MGAASPGWAGGSAAAAAPRPAGMLPGCAGHPEPRSAAEPRFARQRGFTAGDRRGADVISVGARRWQRRVPRRCGAAGPCGVAGGGSDPPSLSGCWRLRLPCRESSVVTESVLLRVFGWGGAAAGQGLGWTRCVVVGGADGGSGLHPRPCGPSGAGRGFWNGIGGPEGCAGGSVARWGQGLSPQPPRLPRTHLCCCHRLWGLVAVFPSTNPGICSGFGHGALPRAPERVTWVWVTLSPTVWGHPGSPMCGCSACGAGGGRASQGAFPGGAVAVTRSCPGTGRSPDDDTARFPLRLASAVAQPWPPVPGSPRSSTAGQTDSQKTSGCRGHE